MTQFENFKNMDIDALTEWLDKHGQFDGSPWNAWWNEKYCNNCPVEHGYFPDDSGEERWYVPTEFAWCEKHFKCKFFPDMDDVPDNKDIIKMWLGTECE